MAFILTSVEVIKSASFLSQIMAREFIFIPPCEELTLTLQEVIDDFVNSEVLNIVVSGHRHGNKKLSYLDMDDDDDDDWLEYTSDVEYKINSESEGENCLGLFSIVLEPFIECYWLVTTQLLLILPLSPGQYLTETGLVEQFQKVAKAKAENGQLSRIESCSSDTIRNAIKILQDMQVLIPVRNGDNGSTNLLEVANSNHLVYMIKQLNCLC